MTAHPLNTLLLYVERVAVDDYGIIDARDLNEAEQQQLKEWNATGYVRYVDGRVSLSVQAFERAHRLRYAKAQRALKVDRKELAYG